MPDTNAFTANQIFYFGDSLTDEGALFALTEVALGTGIPPTALGYNGLFSNGSVLSQFAREVLGVDGQSFAFGGAEAIGEQPLGGGVDINLGAQVASFPGATGGAVPAGTAASILIGSNDFFEIDFADPTSGPAIVGGVVQAMGDAAVTLAEAGVETIIINTLPDPEFFPLIATDPVLLPAAEVAAEAANAGFVTVAAARAAAAGAEVRIVDFDSLSEELVADWLGFGFTVTDQTVVIGGAPGTALNPDLPDVPLDRVNFFDPLHPTDALYGVLGVFQATSLATGDAEFLSQGRSVHFSGADADLVFGRGGADLLFGGGGGDVLFGGEGSDALLGQRGDDIVTGGLDTDQIWTGRGNDVAAGGSGDDLVFGGVGSDLLADGLGADRLFGGRGDDAFYHVSESLLGADDGAGRDVFYGGRGADTLFLLLDDAERAAAEAEIAAARGVDGGWISFGALDLAVVGIEEVVFVEAPGLPGALTDAAFRAEEADLWGIV